MVATHGLYGPRSPECATACRLTDARDDTCDPGVCYARLTPTKCWDNDDALAWYPTPLDQEEEA